MKSLTQRVLSFAILAGALLTAGAASAQANLVVNGGFEQYGPTGPSFYNTQGVAPFPAYAPVGWTSDEVHGYYGNLILAPDYWGNPSEWGYVGVDEGFNKVTPDGGNFLVSYTDPNATGGYYGAVSQTISGLTVGQTYTLTFYQAASTVFDHTETYSTPWNVTFGNSTQSSPLMSMPASVLHTEWEQVSMNFVATDTSQVLSFLGYGTPNGMPQVIIAALDGVSLTVAAVPEPSTLSMMLAAFGLAAALMTSRRRRA